MMSFFEGEGVAPGIIGVIGAGTMGSGIAQLAAKTGARTLLHDPIPEALERGAQRARDGLQKEAAKGKLSDADAQAAGERLTTAPNMKGLAECALVIEAAPERLELKNELYRQLCEVVNEQCVLATNTSSLPVTAIAAAATHPERVVGMHFFNPAPVMKLVEVIAGMRSEERALAVATATGEAMGKTVIRATDGPGFLVNRCNRPFGLEALRMLAERIADVETIDRIVRMEGGFRMGPFELSDLVGVDTGFDVSKSFYELGFGEPRWRPSPIQARMVAAGLHGRKSGRGYYDYSNGPHRPEDPGPPTRSNPDAGTSDNAGKGADTPGDTAEATPTPGEGLVVIGGTGVLADELRAAAAQAGYEVRRPGDAQRELPALIVECGQSKTHDTARGGPHVLLCDRGSLAALDPGGASVGFHVLPPFEQARLVELTRSESSSPAAAARAERFFAALGKHTQWVGDAPGLVLGRIVCQVINESAFALGEGVGSAGDIDTGMKLGMAHPRGPLEWADAIGLDHVLRVLDGLWNTYREERYRPAPELRRLVLGGRLGRAAGAGFFEYGD